MNVNLSVTVKEGRGSKGLGKWSLDSDMGGQATMEDLVSFLKRSLITISSEALKESQDKGEFPKEPDQYLMAVDGRLNKSLEDVKPFGRVEFQRKVEIEEILTFIYQSILDRSPVDTGMFFKYNLLTLNGVQVAKTMSEYLNWVKGYRPKQADVIRFVNIMPYAKRLETRGIVRGKELGSGGEGTRRSKTGTNKKTGKTFAMPTGTYHLTANAANKKYKLNSLIKFKMISGADMDIPSTSDASGRPHRRVTKGSKTKAAGVPYIYPSVYLYVREWGVA